MAWLPNQFSFGAAMGGTVLANLKLAIAERGFKQYDLAARLKISPSQLSEVIRGRRAAESWLRERLAELLRTDEAWLFSTIARIPGPTRQSEQAAVSAVAHPRLHFHLDGGF